MKILIISLLRVGDIFMLRPVLKRLRRLHPESEIHLLINSEFSYVAEVLQEIDVFIPFPRQHLQDICSIQESNLLQPVEIVDELVRSLNQNEYDKVLNLTHNKLSAHLTSIIDCHNKIGVSYDKQNKSIEDSRWFEFLNDRFYFEERSPFHHVDSFYRGSDSVKGETENVVSSVDSVQRAEDWIPQAGSTIVFQLTTSDEKKNWSFDSIVACIARLIQGGHDIAVVCAPGEVDTLSRELSELDVPILGVSFSDVIALLQRSKLLVTLDTSVKHLAGAVDIPIIELALGSANPYETGARGIGNYILKSTEYCAPCKHSQDCFREKKFCEMSFEPEWMSQFIDSVFQEDTQKIESLSLLAESKLSVLKTTEDPFHMWVALPCAFNSSWRTEFSWILRRASYQKLLLSDKSDFEAKSLKWTTEVFKSLTRHTDPANRVAELKKILQDRSRVKFAAEKTLRECRIGPSFPPTLTMVEQMKRFQSALLDFEGLEYSGVIKRTFESCLESAVEGSFITLKKVREYMRQLADMSSWEIKIVNELVAEEESHVDGIGKSIETGFIKAQRGSGENRSISKVR